MNPKIKAILKLVESTLWNDSEDYRVHILDNGGCASTFIINSSFDGSIVFSAMLECVDSIEGARAVARAALTCVAYDQNEIDSILKGVSNE